MSRASRRRRRAPGRGLGQSVLMAIAVAVTVVLVAGSLIAIHTQSKAYRTATTAGYVALVEPLGQVSARTGAELAALMAEAPTLTNSAFPNTARGVLQQGLDVAVRATGDQADQAANLASPPPESGLAADVTRVMRLRATATSALRATVDRLLGMQPLPIAGGSSTTSPPMTTTLISADQAATEMTAEGHTFEQADALYRSVRSSATMLHPPVRLGPSVWVPAPVATAPLGSSTLGATAAALASSSALVAFHHLVLTAVGIVPPAVPSGGVGTVSTSCITPVSTVPGPTPAVVPPTTSLTAKVTVTNCGNVPESHVTISVTVEPADATGATPPPSDGQGGRSTAVVALASGSSSAPVFTPLPVATGHRYTLTVAVSVPPGQADPTGATQRFLIDVTA